MDRPDGLALDTAGNLYFSDRGNRRVRKIAPNG
jgi:sugar lactone lactonase YvrE